MSLTKTKHQRSRALICLGCTAAVWWLANFFGAYEFKEWRWRDTLQQLGRKAPKHPDLIFLGIDNSVESASPLDLATSPELQAMRAGFPWPRWVYGAITERLVEAGAKVVVFDVLLDAEKPDDNALQERFEKYAEHVVIGSNIAKVEQKDGEEGNTLSHLPRLIPPSPSVLPSGERGQQCFGFVTFKPDWDGIVRRTNYRTTFLEYIENPPAPDQPVWLSLTAQAAAKAGLLNRIPETHQQVLFRFPLLEGVSARSIHQIFVDRLWESPTFQRGEVFRNKIVLVGPFGNWSKDELPTPFTNTLGSTLHFSVLNAALQGEFLHDLPPVAENAIIVAAGLIAWLLGSLIVNPLLRAGLLTGFGAAYFGGAFLVYNRFGWFPMLLSPLLALGASGFISSIYEQIIERLEKAKLRKTFERYVSRDVVKELLDNPASYLNTVGGARKRVTVLFSDLRNFTTITESSEPQALVKQLNEYFDAMVTTVFNHDGTLDKFIGDAVMAQWGGIYSAGEKEDATRALRTALEMRQALVRMNPVWKAQGLFELQCGIGLNHGEVTVGNLGCEAKMEVTIVGDAVNAAARLEGMTKIFHCDVLIGETVEPFVRDEFIVRTVALTQPKGKTKPLEIFTILDARTPGAVEPAWLKAHEEGVALYRRRDFATAAARFAKVLLAQPEDWLAGNYLENCHAFMETPPPAGWNAVHVMTTK